MRLRFGYKMAEKWQKKTPTEPFYGFCWVPIGDPYGTRTHDTTVKGWCLNRLTNGPYEIDLIVLVPTGLLRLWLVRRYASGEPMIPP